MRFLGTTANGGWRNPAKHSVRTGVSVLAAGKWWEEAYGNGLRVDVCMNAYASSGLGHISRCVRMCWCACVCVCTCISMYGVCVGVRACACVRVFLCTSGIRVCVCVQMVE